MKRIILISGLLFFTLVNCFAQVDDNDNSNDNIRQKMGEFIQRRLGLSKAEADKFNPVFIRYFREWRNTLRDNKGDKQIIQLRIAELRIRYRPEFRDAIGEKRCNQIYDHQDLFIREVRRFKQEQTQERRFRRNRTVFQ